ncbi:MAG: hypothetical protein IID45_08535 [Planctomycetes bacterium]|nr:hypothetical protein [Planctomycetota bacterium]
MSGNFANAAQIMEDIAAELESGEITLAAKAYEQVAESYGQFAALLKPFQESHSWTTEVIEAARDCEQAAQEKKAGQLADALNSLSAKMKKHAGALKKIVVDKIATIPKFNVKEYREPHRQSVSSAISYALNNNTDDLIEGDLFKDLVHGGSLRIAVRCLDRGQFIGMARPDLFIRQPDHKFWVGFAKAIFGIWLMSLLVIILGVTASCFLKGPIASMLTFFLLVLGTWIHGFLGDMVEGRIEGVGATASVYRLLKHLNPRSELTDVPGARIIAIVDKGALFGLWAVHKIIPNFNNFRVIPYVANGYDVPWSAALLPGLMTILGFAFPCLVIGYFSLTLRELEDK